MQARYSLEAEGCTTRANFKGGVDGFAYNCEPSLCLFAEQSKNEYVGLADIYSPFVLLVITPARSASFISPNLFMLFYVRISL